MQLWTQRCWKNCLWCSLEKGMQNSRYFDFRCNRSHSKRNHVLRPKWANQQDLWSISCHLWDSKRNRSWWHQKDVFRIHWWILSRKIRTSPSEQSNLHAFLQEIESTRCIRNSQNFSSHVWRCWIDLPPKRNRNQLNTLRKDGIRSGKDH